MINGTLEYMMNEAVVYPHEGQREKAFDYKVMFQVYANEPRYTEEEIEKEIAELERKLAMETEEMFPEEKEKDDTSSVS